MLENEKRAMYNRIMEKVSTDVKRMLNEAGIPQLSSENGKKNSTNRFNEIQAKINSLTAEEKLNYFNRQFNVDYSKKQCQRFPNTFHMKNNSFYMNIIISDKTNKTKEIQLFGKSYGDILKKLDILDNANYTERTFIIQISNAGGWARRVFCWLSPSREYQDKQAKLATKCYHQVFEDTKSLNELIDKLKKFKFEN